MSLIHLSTELRQELKLTPQLLQSMELLQMNSQELLDYLNQVSEENPLVEQTDLSSLHKAYEALRQKVHWINGGLPEDGHGAMPERGVTDRETESLSAFLCDQLERLRRNLRRAREQELTPRQREVLALYYDRGLKMSQIARKLGINRSTVSRTIGRAKQRLYRYLQYTL